MLKPLTTRSAQTDKNRVLLYASPQFIRPDGKIWTPIHQAMRIRPTATGFRVEYGDAWAELAPAKSLLGFKESVSESGHFGWQLDARSADEELAWSVKHSKDAERIDDGIVLGRPDGVPLGLFWADWRQHKPQLSGDELTINVSAAKAAAISSYEALGSPKDSYPLLDLDPTVQLSLDDWTTGGVTKSQGDPVPPARELWDLVRAETDADGLSQAIGLIVRGGRNATIAANFVRGFLKFDTSAYGADRVTAVTLYMNFETGAPLGATSDQCHVSRVTTFNSGSFAVSDYGKVKDDGAGGGYDNNPIGYMSAGLTGEWCTRAIDVGDYAAESEYGLGLAFEWDVEDDYDSGTDYRTPKFYSSGEGTPYLALTVNPCYRLYRGIGGVEDVDFDTPVDTLLTAASQIVSTGLGHAVSTQYTYVLRPVRWYSGVGIETPDLSCAVEMTTDSEGAWVGERPPAVRNVEAFVEDSGDVRVRWFFRLDSGQTAPTNFGVWYAAEPDVDTSGAPNATVTYTRAGKFYEHTFTLTDGVAYWFAVKARTATNASDAVIAGPYIADSTAPDAPILGSGASW